MKISWRKNAKATGYEVQYATNSKFTKPSKLSLSSKYSKKTVKKLKKGKKYYVRIRSKNSGGHSEWSKTKAVTIKK